MCSTFYLLCQTWLLLFYSCFRRIFDRLFHVSKLWWTLLRGRRFCQLMLWDYGQVHSSFNPQMHWWRFKFLSVFTNIFVFLSELQTYFETQNWRRKRSTKWTKFRNFLFVSILLNQQTVRVFLHIYSKNIYKLQYFLKNEWEASEKYSLLFSKK